MENNLSDRIDRTVALIPARAGSKRIANKNRIDVGGKPLIWYSVEYALRDIAPERVVISTDDPLIEELGDKWGVRIIRRPKSLATDSTTSGQVMRHTAAQLSNKFSIDWIILLQPTNPFRPRGLLNQILGVADRTVAPSVVSVSPLLLKFGRIDEDGCLIPVNYTYGQRSQDMKPEFFYENGLLYCTSIDLARNAQVLDSRPKVVPVRSWHAAIDIDEPEHLEAARVAVERYNKEIKNSGF